MPETRRVFAGRIGPRASPRPVRTVVSLAGSWRRGSSAGARRARRALGRSVPGPRRRTGFEVSGMLLNLLAFTLAAMLEIAGCFAFWRWLRDGRSPLVALAGVLSLIGFAAMLTRVDAAFAGRAYAAYGGVYIAASLGWLLVVEGQRPTTTDIIGAAVAIVGAIIIIGFAGRR